MQREELQTGHEGIQWLSVTQCGTLQLNIYWLGSVSAGITGFACAPWILEFEVRLTTRKKLAWMVLFDAGKVPALTKAGLVTPQSDAIRQAQAWSRLQLAHSFNFHAGAEQVEILVVRPRRHRHAAQSRLRRMSLP